LGKIQGFVEKVSQPQFWTRDTSLYFL